ncbi:MAG: PAC2 family protein [Chloroflexi bacterium]|nr:PAC2 family protein [Chloroflexota bacterium]
MALIRLTGAQHLDAPVVVAAFDGWVDAGSGATTAADLIARDASEVATFDGDRLFDYRARRPTLEIIDGRPSDLTWPELRLMHRRFEGRDVLVLTGPEPDYRWRQLAAELVQLARAFEVSEWISLGAIPAAVPHTRPVTILGTASSLGQLRADVEPGPVGTMTVPSACISVLDMAAAAAGVPAVGYYAQIPHYVSGEYPAASLELLSVLGKHLGVRLPQGTLSVEAKELRERLDAAADADASTRAYVERLEGMADESKLPSGTELISEIERFLRDRGAGSEPRGS